VRENNKTRLVKFFLAIGGWRRMKGYGQKDFLTVGTARRLNQTVRLME
jgi:hypothetical protein